MFLLVVVLAAHVSFGRCISCPCFFWSLYCLSMFLLVVVLSVQGNITPKRNMDRQYNYQKKHGETIQRPKETWTDNTTSKRNMDNCLSMFLLVVVLPVHVSFGRCIACPCFFWSFYCLSMLPLVVVLPVHVSFGRCIACPLQRPKETWTDNTTAKRNMDRQYNYQKKHEQAMQRPKETWTDNTTTKRNMDRQYVVLPVHVSFGRCISCPCFFWSFYCLSMLPLVVVLPVHL
jgi:heme exporter protein D